MYSCAHCCSSVPKLCLTFWDPQGLSHTRPFCPPLSPRICSNSYPLSWWCYITISPSATRFSCLQFPSIRVFSSESALLIKWSKYWSFSFSISLSSECSRLISSRINWFDILAVQRILKTLLQHLENLKASILQHSAFLMVHLSHPVHDDWKSHSFDYMDPCQKSDVADF